MTHPILRLLFPPVCLSCKNRLPYRGEDALCPICFASYQSEKEGICPVCGKMASTCLCLLPGMETAGLSGLVKLIPYRPMLAPIPASVIYTLKHENLHAVREFFVGQLAPRLLPLTKGKACAVCYMPRSKSGIAKDGFDQAKELAKALAKALSLPLVSALCRTGEEDASQKERNRTERKEAAKKAYACKDGVFLAGKQVFLIDDVVTTGATLSAGARRLKEAGAKKVIGVVCAYTPRIKTR